MILLDTNIVSFLFKRDSRTNDYAPHLDEQLWAISLMTVAELYQWAFVRTWSSHRLAQLEMWIARNFTVLPNDAETSRLWGQIVTECRTKGRPISAQDAWIAASALQHGLTLVTHNPSDFEAISTLAIITEATQP